MASFVGLTKAEAAYQELRARILDGRLAPGSVNSIEKLALDLSVSTTPLREAVRKLAGEYLLDAPPHREVVIAPLTIEGVQEIYELRLILDPLAASKATRRATPEDIKAVRDVLNASRQYQPKELFQLNHQLHREIYKRCGNQILVRALDSLCDRSDRYRFLLLEVDETATKATEEHEAIVDAYARGAADSMQELVYEHIAASQAAIVARMKTNAD